MAHKIVASVSCSPWHLWINLISNIRYFLTKLLAVVNQNIHLSDVHTGELSSP